MPKTLKEILEEKRISQAELSRASGINQTIVNQIVGYVSGKGLVSAENRGSICKSLEMTEQDVVWPEVK